MAKPTAPTIPNLQEPSSSWKELQSWKGFRIGTLPHLPEPTVIPFEQPIQYFKDNVVVALDYDGVVNLYLGFEEDDNHLRLLPNVELCIRLFRHVHACEVIIFTARNNAHEVVEQLYEQGIEIDVYNCKPPASIYIDDRGFRFEGIWNENIVEQVIETLRKGPHWGKDPLDWI